MPAIVLVRLFSTAEPRDDAVNVLHVSGPPPFDVREDIADATVDLYQTLGVASPSPAIFGTPGLNGNGEVRIYDFADATPRAPLHVEPFTFNTASTSQTSQVAAAVSYRGAQASGVNMARRRGRTFLGPLQGGVMVSTEGRMQLSPAFREKCVDTFEAFAEQIWNIGTSVEYEWSIYSRTNDEFVPVRHIWMTAGPDVIRSRKTRPTLERVSVDISPPTP